MNITSLQNPRVKSILRLRSNSRERQRSGLFLLEGADEIRLALAAGHRPRIVMCAPELAAEELARMEGEQLGLSAAVFRKISFRENPDGWMAVFERPRRQAGDLRLSSSPLIMLVESVEKPGNLGAVLRTADAAGVEAVMVCDGRADVYGPNVVRASRGALLSVPVVELTSAQALEYLRGHDIKIVATNPNAGQDYTAADLTGPLAVAIGTEDVGLSTLWLEQADIQVRIPMVGKVNSLNVSVAGALILYEALRQRGLP